MSRISSPELVGRTREFHRLRAALDAAVRSEANAVLVAGDAGVGKTRLVSHFATYALDQGARVLKGVCSDLGGGGLPLEPVVQAWRPILREMPPEQIHAVLGPARSELARIFPELAEGAAVPSGPPDNYAQARLFELLLRLIEEVSTARPTVLVIEDLHWADASTRELFAFVARNVWGKRLLPVGTYRADELHRRHPLRRFVVELQRGAGAEQIELRPLPRPQF